MRGMHRVCRICGKKNILAHALLCAVFLSSCKSGGDLPSASAVPESTPAAVTSSAEYAPVSGEIPPEEISETTVESVSDATETEAPSTEITDRSESESASGQSSSVTDISVSSADRASDASISEQRETASQTASETSPPVTEVSSLSATEMSAAKPAEIIIPDIKIPLANGASVISEEKAEIDYGNASDGYISVVYSGSSAQAKLRIANGSVQYDHDLSTDGKREFFPLMGSGSYSVKVYEHVSGKNFALILSGEFEVSMKNETHTFLYPNKYVNYGQNSECVKKAAELCAGKSSSVEEIAAVFEYISENIIYDKQLAATVKSGYIPDPDKTLASGKGICFDYASLFAAMCRSRSIPARLVIGYAEPNIYHAWNEVYTDETGWITPELFLKKKGYNIADATFYASNSDKKKIAEYISDEGNYSAIYRY